jgi:hypothetical protein
MFDPGALGTLMIGLEAVRSEQIGEPRRHGASSRQTTKRRAFRAVLAAGLHNLADRLERPVTQAAPG